MRCRPAALTPVLRRRDLDERFPLAVSVPLGDLPQCPELLLEAPDLGPPVARQLLRFGGAPLLRRDLVSRDDAVGHQGRGEGLVHGGRQRECPDRGAAGGGALGDHAGRRVELARAGEVDGRGTGALAGALPPLFRVAQFLLELAVVGSLATAGPAMMPAVTTVRARAMMRVLMTHSVLSTWCLARQR